MELNEESFDEKRRFFIKKDTQHRRHVKEYKRV